MMNCGASASSGVAKPKPHHCIRCDRNFARLEHLRRHERSHTKERPFRCEKCSLAFTRKDLLVRHHRLTHEPQQDQISVINEYSQNQSVISLPPTPAADLEGDVHVSTLSALPLDTLASDEQPLYNPHLIEGELAPFVGHDTAAAPYNTELFSSFFDSLDFPSNPFSPAYNPLPYFSPDSLLAGSQESIVQERPDSGFSRFGSRLPSLQPDDSQPQQERQNPTFPITQSRSHVHPKIKSSCRDRIIDLLKPFSHIIAEAFVLPSRHTLERFIFGYLTGFNEHFPILHIPTLSFDSLSVELFLSIAALGAQYCREPDRGAELYQVAKAVVFERVRKRNVRDAAENNSQSRARHGSEHINNDELLVTSLESRPRQTFIATKSNTDSHMPETGETRLIETAQALLLLIALSTWSKTDPSAYDALSLRSMLERLVTDDELDTAIAEMDDPWRNYIERESVKRTKLLVFCFFNIHTIVFDVPPMVLFTDINMNLPCTNREWNATTSVTWQEARSSSPPEPGFQDALKSLFSGGHPSQHTPPLFSPLGGYILIHAVIQHIWLLQQASRLAPKYLPTLPPHQVATIENALKRWRDGWERDKEASISPVNPHGPLSFNSTALLRMAYIRINIDSGSVRSLNTFDPLLIASSLAKSAPVQRGDKMTRAALHCAHALSIPVKFGINFVAHTQVFYWSNQHALCSLECALLLSKWLGVVAVPSPDPPLSREERRVLEFVVQMVGETVYAGPLEKLLENNTNLATVVVRVWAKLFRPDSIWEMVYLIGRSLNAYADLLESRAVH